MGSDRIDRIIRLPELKSRLGISRSSIYDRMTKESDYYDPRFPAKVRMGGRAVGWIESEVAAYLRLLAAERSVAPGV